MYQPEAFLVPLISTQQTLIGWTLEMGFIVMHDLLTLLSHARLSVHTRQLWILYCQKSELQLAHRIRWHFQWCDQFSCNLNGKIVTVLTNQVPDMSVFDDPVFNRFLLFDFAKFVLILIMQKGLLSFSSKEGDFTKFLCEKTPSVF